MKYVKMLGLAAIAAAALMAFVGAGTASATVLCTTPGIGEPTGTTCQEGWAYIGDIHAVNSGEVKLDTTFKTVSCTGSTITWTANEGDSTHTVTGPEGELTFTGCNCTVNVLKAGTLEVHWIPGTHNGTVTSNETEVTVSCSTIFGNVHCIYETTNDSIGDLTADGKDPIFHSTAVIPKKPTSGLCSEESTWTATYTVTTPHALYVNGHT